MEQETNVFALLEKTYEIEASNNPYFAGTIYLFSRGLFNPKVSELYDSPTTYYTTWELTIGGKTFKSPSEPTINGFIQDGIRFVGVPDSETKDVQYWINANDLCEALGVKEHFSYMEIDPDTGLEQVLVFG